jgi:hypothetical protein
VAFARPAFLGEGFLSWRGQGYRFTDAVPPDLGERDALAHGNPWIVFAAALERAKAGRFEALPALFECLRRSDSWVLAQGCAELLGDAGSSAVVRQAVETFRADLFEDEDFRFQIKLSHTLSLSGQLWAVPVLLDVYSRARDEQEAAIIPVLISHMLEPEYGPVATTAPGDSAPDAEYRALVMERYHRLRGRFGTDQVPVLYGERYGVRFLAERLHAHLSVERPNAVVVARERHYFEAATGLDCRSFFEGAALRPLSAIATVEDFLEGADAPRYEAGVRYFFGHRITD